MQGALRFLIISRNEQFSMSFECLAPGAQRLIGLPTPPYDKSTSNRYVFFVFPLSHTEWSSPYVAERAPFAFLINHNGQIQVHKMIVNN